MTGAYGDESLRPDLLPVVVGGDIGAYALARQLHEATGQQVTLIASQPIQAIALSGYIEVVYRKVEDLALIAVLRSLAQGRRPRSAVVMTNLDSVAHTLVSHRDELEPTYVVPFPSRSAMERLSNKVSFAQACEALGLRTPRQVAITGADLAASDPQIDIPLPLVGKAAIGSDWDRLNFEGKRKIYFLDTPEQLHDMWEDLRRAGFESTFLVQERIPGEDHAMRSVTAYIDSAGSTGVIGSARVLLEDHAPSLIGNPVAMITEPFPELWEAAERLLAQVDYRGFANFDIKIDPRDGQPVFFEVNPRIGRNCYYLNAAGVNPMLPMIQDLVDCRPGPRQEADREALYSLLPHHLLLHQLDDPVLRRRVLRLAPRAVDPLLDPAERSLRRRLLVAAQKLNHDRKFHRFHPKPLLRRR
ncbi:carboxylate--amine ligase [Actinomyces qiguomingii]|uniref:carboxylate--amine ligase n=1 Tax=Actinomyces qiguomingii TaxID=2057800 RepID=UPI001E42CE2B|nr:carboxylate--amine ligase [Actinomyces qiguomingii]